MAWRIGFPLDPTRPLREQVEWGENAGFDYVELFFEPPLYSPEKVDTSEVVDVLESYCKERIGHTPWYLPLCSPVDGVRLAGVEEAKRYLDVFSEVGVDRATVHLVWTMPGTMFSVEDEAEWSIESLGVLADYAATRGIRLMVEPVGDPQQTPEVLKKIVKSVGRLWVNCDVPHVLRGGHDLEGFLKTLKKWLLHAHFHDIRGKEDHLPLGVSREWRDRLLLLKKYYKGPVTLEVFGARELLEASLGMARRVLG